MALDQGQVEEAIEQVLVHCEHKYFDAYQGVSLRGSLYDLGFSSEAADEVIEFVYAGGFTYCLDPSKSATHFDPNNPAATNDMVTDYPSEDACYWGPDQLASRLCSLSNYRAKGGVPRGEINF